MKHNHWWESISNVSAIAASIIPIKIEGLNFVGILVLGFLLLSYMTARKIKDCKTPLLRVLSIWSIFSVGFVGVITPILSIANNGLNKYAGISFLIGIIFALLTVVLLLIAKSHEKNT